MESSFLGEYVLVYSQGNIRTGHVKKVFGGDALVEFEDGASDPAFTNTLWVPMTRIFMDLASVKSIVEKQLQEMNDSFELENLMEL